MNLRTLPVLFCLCSATMLSAQSFRVKITTGLSVFNDEAKVQFYTGAPTIDPADVPKVGFGLGPGPKIACVSADGADMELNAYGPFGTDITIPFKVSGPVSGAYAITIYSIHDLFGSSCIVLEDVLEEVSTPILAGTAYQFNLDVNTPTDPPRFVFHLSAPLEPSVTDASCSNMSNGSVSIPLTGAGPWMVSCTDDQGGLVQQVNSSSSPISLAALAQGQYDVTISNNDGCARTLQATVGAVPAPLADFSIASANVAVNDPVAFSNGSIGHTASSWEFGDGGASSVSSPTHAYTTPGEYQVDLTVSNGPCTAMAATTVFVGQANGIEGNDPLEARVFVQGDHITVICPYASKSMNAALFSANGRAASEQQRAMDGRTPMYIPTTGLAAGGYVLRVWDTEGMRSYMVPVAR
ncbi:MAG: PKD domain-containing protein [Flavobacteriales bacterium]|nr:MAG: PKD domain-containing protein [Flavobacteriales bacterium]